ncbi:hypothetical protein EC973_002933 [Apophysomyces ossiformis]|uniref:Uncharacterized protein n=1 Tax=Apophysomyces ossiformis TaxID=679940 RepID=A0A8H7BHQ1_9FUNG|nr:hypothetical protein EC973_002933 [Apophysomyces ossiformis]
MARRQHRQHENGQNGHFKHSEANGVPIGKERVAKQPNGGFVSRVTSLPIVKDSVSTANAFAHKTRLGQFALSTANTTWSTLSSRQPAAVQNYYEAYIKPHVQKADDLGCQSLDAFQKKFPVIAEPTGDLVNRVVTPAYQIIDGVKVRVNTTINTVTAPAYVVTRASNRQLGKVVDQVETVIDRYLPPNEKKSRRGKDQDQENANQAWRAYLLLTEASVRLSQRVADQVRAQWPAEELSGMIRSVTDSIQLLQETLRHSVIVYSHAAQERFAPNLPSHVEHLRKVTHDQLERLIQHTSNQLQQIYTFIETQSSEKTPEWLKIRIQSLMAITQEQLALVRQEYARTDISSYDKAKHVAQSLQEQVLPSLQAIQLQLQKYTKKAQDELKWPLEYLGFIHHKVQ